MPIMTAALILLLAWSLFAFGAVYEWGIVPLLLVSATGALTAVAAPERRRAWLDLWLLALAGVILLQLIPLPEALRRLLSPHQAAYFDRVSLVPPATGTWLPLTLYPGAWIYGAGASLAGLATFVWARDSLQSRGVRRVMRAIGWMALVASAYALVQPALFPDGRIYGFWKPYWGTRGGGPMVSRNHFAAWIVLAWPLTVGYLVAHARTHWQDRRVSRAAVILGDTRAMWLVLSAALMLGALLVTQSRAGLIGLAVAAFVLVAEVWRRTGTAGRVGMAAFLGLVALTVSLWASPDAVLYRFGNAWSGADGGRPEIWAQTMTIVRDFPLSGIGLGTFDLVMPAYQTSAFTSLINHAHNQYLHLLAEGGVLLAVPLVGALVTFAGTAWHRMRRDHTALVHVRQGAFAGLCGLAVQSVFDVPFLTPGVLILAAVCAAVVVRGTDPDAAERAEDSEG